MTVVDKIQELIQARHLLKHPFYQAWTRGELTQSTLREYARQYYAHVEAFPRYLSATHSLCDNIKDRQVLLENLNEEEHGPKNHPELWMQFAEGMGAARSEVKNVEQNPESKALVDTFMNVSRSSYAEGLAGLYTYESQVPAVAEVKIDGLKKFYGVTDEKTLEFFTVHEQADVVHSQMCEKQLKELSSEQEDQAVQAADKTTQALWNFLTGVHERACATQ